jgi:hypothetical protein
MIAEAPAAHRVKSVTLDGEGVVCGPDGGLQWAARATRRPHDAKQKAGVRCTGCVNIVRPGLNPRSVRMLVELARIGGANYGRAGDEASAEQNDDRGSKKDCTCRHRMVRFGFPGMVALVSGDNLAWPKKSLS